MCLTSLSYMPKFSFLNKNSPDLSTKFKFFQWKRFLSHRGTIYPETFCSKQWLLYCISFIFKCYIFLIRVFIIFYDSLHIIYSVCAISLTWLSPRRLLFVSSVNLSCLFIYFFFTYFCNFFEISINPHQAFRALCDTGCTIQIIMNHWIFNWCSSGLLQMLEKPHVFWDVFCVQGKGADFKFPKHGSFRGPLVYFLFVNFDPNMWIRKIASGGSD